MHEIHVHEIHVQRRAKLDSLVDVLDAAGVLGSVPMMACGLIDIVLSTYRDIQFYLH